MNTLYLISKNITIRRLVYAFGGFCYNVKYEKGREEAMKFKRGLLLIEMVIAVLLSGFPTPSCFSAIDVSCQEPSVMEDEITEYEPSINDYIYHFEDDFTDVQQQAWVIQKTDMQTKPYPNSGSKKTIVKYETVTLTGTNDYQYWRILFNNQTYYIDKDCITTDYAEFKKVMDATKDTGDWTGTRLNIRLGTVKGPSGKETYYNLYMGNIIDIMRRYGNYDKYWIRDDGVKMLGDYVMVAASLDIRPRNTLIPTSLGMGIVCDTGGFALRNKTQLDIAVNW